VGSTDQSGADLEPKKVAVWAATKTRNANSSRGIPSGILTPSASCPRSSSSTIAKAGKMETADRVRCVTGEVISGPD
jgi:hypothetical protein